MKFYKKIIFIICLGSIFILSSNIYSKNTVAFDEPVWDNFIQRDIFPYESITFDFLNFSNLFSVETDTFLNLYLEYDFFIFYREATIIINNTNPINLNISCVFDLEGFLSQLPDDPSWEDMEDLFILYQYNCYYRIYSNTSIDRLTFRFAKKDIYNLNSTLNYTLAFFESELTAWEAFETFERNITGSDEVYLEGTLTNLKPETDYYITIFEVEEELPPPPPPTPRDDDWFGLLLIILIPIIVVFIGLIIVVSKEEYLDFIKNRFANVNRGAHRLKMEEVLDNENRNKLIDLILKSPGIHFNNIMRKTGLTPGSLVWHLTMLETYKIIKKEPFENYVVYYPYYQKNPISNIDLKLKKSDLTLKILEAIKTEPGIWNNKITDKLRIHRKTIQYHIKKLIDLNLVIRKKAGNKKHLYINIDSDYFKNGYKSESE